MESSNTPLAELTPNNDHHTIMVRVSRIWEAINKRSGATIHTNVILLDEKDNHMVAIIRNNQKQLYLQLIKEKEVYSISNFKVVPGPKQYKSVDADYTINFYYKTKIEKLSNSTVIPLYKFELQPFPAINGLVGNVAMLIDVLGMVKNYGNLERRNNGAHKMDVLLTDHRYENMLVTLWEDRAKEFLDLLSTTKEGPVFVVITGLLAKKYSDAASLSSTDATRSYMNINYPPLKDLKDSLTSGANEKQQTLPPPTTQQFFTSTGDIVHELPITTILETVIPPNTLAVRCICRGKIVAILDGNGWFYNCCPTCARALRDLNGKFYCLNCNEEIDSLAQRYRIVARVEDHSGSTTITLFNKEAEQLVGIPLQKILAEDEEAKMEVIPHVIRNIIGKECTFQIKITPYNIIQGSEEYTVTRVSEITKNISKPDMSSTSIDATTTIALDGANKKQKLA